MRARAPRLLTRLGLALGMACLRQGAAAYPTDSGERTGIRRLSWQAQVDRGETRGVKNPPGGRWGEDRIRLRLLSSGARFRLSEDSPKDPVLQKGLTDILKRGGWESYGAAIVDISDPEAPRYAAVNELKRQIPGSTAKVLAAAGMLEALRSLYPDDIAARERALRTIRVPADSWAMPNSHDVPILTAEGMSMRPIRPGDVFSLWEWLDHALSPSSNAAGTMVWREAALLRLLGREYPPAAWDGKLFARWSRQDFTKAAFDAVDAPQAGAGLDTDLLRIRTFFTAGASRHILSSSSVGTPLGLAQWLLSMEQGRIVDPWSSLELKRLLYVTRRRIRSAAAPELAECAVYFKSGSLYKCRPEEGFVCKKYMGNDQNLLNSLALVEVPSAEPDEGGRHRISGAYIVAVTSNVLKRNSADDHARLAGAIHRLLTGRQKKK
ncbi:MAG: hypothetical protein ABII00_03600 [Elusimicrobiota bacterium]